MSVCIVKSLSSSGKIKDHAICKNADDATKIRKWIIADEEIMRDIKVLWIASVPIMTFKDYSSREMARIKKEKVAADKKLARQLENFAKEKRNKTE